MAWLTVSAVMLLVASTCMGEVVSDPYKDYAKEVLRQHQKHGDDNWNGYEIGLEDMPDGGYILRCFYDLVGDQEKELFLYSTASPAQSWGIYSKAKRNHYTVITRDLYDQFLAFYVSRKDSQSSVTMTYTKGDWVSVRQAEVSMDGIGPFHSKVYKDEEARALLEQRDWPEALGLGEIVYFVDLNLEKVTFAELLRLGPKAKWRPYYRGEGPARQQRDPKEERIARETTLSPADARRLLNENAGQ